MCQLRKPVLTYEIRTVSAEGIQRSWGRDGREVWCGVSRTETSRRKEWVPGFSGAELRLSGSLSVPASRIPCEHSQHSVNRCQASEQLLRVGRLSITQIRLTTVCILKTQDEEAVTRPDGRAVQRRGQQGKREAAALNVPLNVGSWEPSWVCVQRY